MPDAQVPCTWDPGATAEELASTPRADTELELLALALGTRIVADQATYHGLDCLNAQYGARVVGTHERGVSLSFEGLYAIDRLACRYRAAPGVSGVFPGMFPPIGDGPKLFAWREGDAFYHVFDHAGGDHRRRRHARRDVPRRGLVCDAELGVALVVRVQLLLHALEA